MNEQEYIDTTNRVKITFAKSILYDVLFMDSSEEKELKSIIGKLSGMEEMLFKRIKIKT